jgi:hypothetical protein
LALGLAAPAPARADGTRPDSGYAAGGGKLDRLRTLQLASRIYQVCLGRSIRSGETGAALTTAASDLAPRLLAGEEGVKVYAQRLASYAEGSVNTANATELQVPAKITALAQVDRPLETVLKNLERGRHGGEPCGAKGNAVCFAGWLVGRVAPSLGAAWVKQRASELPGWSYARLMEEISASSDRLN